MESALITKVRQVLIRAFPQSNPQIEPVRGNGRVWGILVWPDFADQSHLDRQRQLHDVLKRELNQEELSRISAILTMTPDELSSD